MLTSTLLKVWREGAEVFTNSGYALFNIEAHVFSIMILVILFIKQANSNKTEPQIIWSRMLFVQILYCFSGISRVLVDINIITKTNLSQYFATAINFGLFGCLCWLMFLYIELYQETGIFS